MLNTDEILFQLIKKHTHYDSCENDMFYYNLYVDRNESTLPSHMLKKIFNNDNPRQTFVELLSELATENSIYEENNLIETIKQHTDIDEEIIVEYIHEHCSFNYDENDFNESYHINLMLDTGDAKTDFTPNNALNYYSSWSTTLEEPSAILWLAKQMGKSELLLSEMNRIYSNEQPGEYVNRDVSKDTFVESVIQELENNSCCCAGLTFLVNMKLQDLFLIKENMSNENMKDKTITISKDTMCGLFDAFAGGGSVLEIQLDKDLEIPYAFIHDIWIDGTSAHTYDINDVYGLTNECWNGNIKVA